MRITGFHVDGFGVLHDTGTDQLGPGLTVVSGHNGAGKSSLHAFLTRVLFGIPRSNALGVTRAFEPLRGGRQGGSIDAVDRDGAPWRIQRIKGGNPTLQVEGPDGASTSRDALRPLLGDLDRERFEQLFAIDLDNLIGIDDLPGEELQQMLFDAAVLGTAGSLRAARTLAEDRAETLYKPSGRVQPIAEAKREKRELETKLGDARQAVEGLTEMRDRVVAVTEEGEQVAAQIAELDRELSTIEQVQRAWPRFRDAASLRAEADELAGPDVPAEVRTAVAAARDDRDDAAALIQQLTGELEPLVDERRRIAVDQQLLDAGDAIEGLHAELAVHEDRRSRHAQALDHHRTAEEDAEQAVARVAAGWTAHDVRQVAVDGDAVDRVRTAADALDTAVASARTARTDAEQATAEVARQRAVIERREAELPDVPGRDELARRATALATLRAHLPVIDQAQVAARLRVGPDAGGAAARPGQARALLPVGALALGVLLTATGVALSLLALTLAGGLVAAVGAYLLGRAREGAADDGPAAPIGHGEAALRSARSEVAAAAAVLGLPADPTTTQLASAETQLTTDRADVQARLESERDLADRRGQLRDLSTQAETLAGTADAAELERDGARDTLVAVCTAVGLPWDATTPPDSVVRLHARVAEAASALGRLEAAGTDAAGGGDALEQFRERATRVCVAAGRPDVDGEAAVRAIAGLHRDVAEARGAEHRATTCGERIDGLSHARKLAEEQVDEATSAIEEICGELGVEDDRQLDVLIGRHDDRDARHRDATAAEEEVERLLGTGAAAARGRELLHAGDVTGWQTTQLGLREQRRERDQRRDELLKERVLLQREIDDLGGDDTIPKLALEVEMVQEQLDELSHRWAVLEVARTVLTAAVEHFESQQQPVVLEEASRLFAAFTCGAWREVRQVDQRLMALAGDDREMIAVDQLSTGEQAQLYLALRVALATHRSSDLPLLLDDLLQSSDDERSAAICASLSQLAQDRQVLLFTPSRRMMDAALDAIPDAGHVLLDGGRVVEAVAGGGTGSVTS